VINGQGGNVETVIEAASSLARIFKRLRKHGKMTLAEGVPHDSPQEQIVNWLIERYGDFINNLTTLLRSNKGNLQVRPIVD
jgi:cytochrome c-type biogenesis protein CcmH/NrfF